MTLGDLIRAVREALDDTATPYLYDDEELTRYLNNAVDEVAIRTRMLQDDNGPACRIDLVAGQARYEYAEEVIVIRAVHVPGRSKPVVRTTAARMDRIRPGWAHEAQQHGIPEYAVMNLEQKAITLVPPPAEAGVMQLRVWRMPDEGERMEATDDEAEPVLFLHGAEGLKHWALFECYMKKDGELHDPKRAETHLGLFEGLFGSRPSLHQLTLWSTQPTTGPRRAAGGIDI